MSPARIGCVVCVALLLFAARVAGSPDPTYLRAGAEHTNVPLRLAQNGKLTPTTPASGTTGDEYEIELDAGQYLCFIVKKDGDLNLSVTLFGPGRREIVTMANNDYGPFQVTHIAAAAGLHSILVRPLETDAAGAHYELQLAAEPRPATAGDRQNNAAVWASIEAEKLRARWEAQSLRGAIEKYAEAAALWHAAGHGREEAAALNSIGGLYFVLSEYGQAKEFHRRALELSRANGDELGAAEALNNIARVYNYQSRHREALPYLERALARGAQRTAPERRRVEAQTLNNFGVIYYERGELKQALEHFRRALALWTEAADRRGQALAHLNIGYTNYDMGDTQAAADCYERSLALWRATAERRGEAQAQTALGGVYAFRGEKQAALRLHEEAAQILRAVNEYQGEASALNGTGRIFEELNKPEVALDQYKRALELYQLAGNRTYEALTEYYLGRVYRTTKDLQQALTHYQRTIALSRAAEEERFEAYALKDIGTIYAALGEKQKALARYEQVLRLYLKFGDRRGQALTLNSIGLIHADAGAGQRALGFYQRALALYHWAGDVVGEAQTRYHIARAAHACGDSAEAAAQIKTAIDMIEGLRTRIASYELRSSYFASIHDYYNFYITLLMRLHKERPSEGFAAEALQVSESARARSLLEALNEARVDIRQGAAPELLERERALREQLSARTRSLMRLRNNRRTDADADAVEAEIRQLTNEYDEVQARIREQSPRYAALAQPRPLTTAEMQAQLLDNQTVLLEYALGDKQSYLWVLTPTALVSYELPGRAQIEEEARKVYQLLTARQPRADEEFADYRRRVAEADQQYWARAAALSELLLGPAAEQIADKRLLIVADGVLQYIPFEALPAPETVAALTARPAGDGAEFTDDAEPLMLRHEVVNLPSVSTLALLRQEETPDTAARKTIAVLADPVFSRADSRVTQTRVEVAGDTSARPVEASYPSVVNGQVANGNVPRLPSTSREAQVITACTTRDERIIATGFEASRPTVMSGELSRYRIVHFATHGIVNDQHPELSGLLLSLLDADGRAADGFLPLHDIYNLKLRADLVVLSACSTGLGQEVKGEGLVGLTRGFMYAGSGSVVASLWKVDDQATAELMDHFYKALLQDGRPLAAALREAKQEMWRQRRWRAPYYWAAFVLQGKYQQSIRPAAGGGGALKVTASTVIFLSLLGGCLALGLRQSIRLARRPAL